MPKLCQLIATLGVVCVITMALGAPPMVALPADTTPPVGCAKAVALHAIVRAAATMLHETLLPALHVFSATATKVAA
jgi:hypothetical protein